MYASNYFETAMLNLLRGSSNSITAPANLYLGLFISNPTDTGSAGTEMSYSGYQRQPITFAAPITSGSTVYTTNSAKITFPEAAASAGNVTYIGVFDAQTGGNMWLYSALTTALNVQAGVSPVFVANSIRFTWSGNLSIYYKTAIINTLRGTNLSGFNPYIALCNGDPTGAGSEFSGNNYSRISVAFTAPTQQTSGVAQTKNSAAITSGVSSGTWGTLTHIAIYDASSSGNAYAVFPIGASYNIAANSSVGFRAGEIKVTVN